jgi:hypothetical protein
MSRTISISLPLLVAMGCSNGFLGDGEEPEENYRPPLDEGNGDDPADEEEEEVDASLIDDDGDGLSESEGDCDDTDADISPDAEEVPYDGIDNDCDEETVDDDLDGDGFGIDEDCNDEAPDIFPGADEDYTDGEDNDCDDLVDERFEAQTIDDSTYAGLSSAMDVDSQGQVHVAYTDSYQGNIRYMMRDVDGKWTGGEQAVPAFGGTSGTYMDAVVDSDDRFQLAYTWTHSAGTQLEYGYLNGSQWTYGEVVDNAANSGSNNLGFYVSIDVDAGNAPSFAYMDYDAGVPALADSISNPILSLFLDVIYTDLDYNYEWEVYQSTGFGTMCNIGYFTSLVIDEDGYDNVAYYDDCTAAKQAQFTRLDLDLDSIVWSETIADDGFYTDLAWSSEGVLCTAFQNSSNGGLYFGCTYDKGGSWTIEEVDTSEGFNGAYASVAFNAKDQPYIAYYNSTTHMVKVAHDGGDGWTIINIDEVGDYDDVGDPIDLAIDSSDTVHIVYHNDKIDSLEYAQGH